MRDSLGVIGVLMGGPSAEREISLKSGHAVVQALTSQGHRVVPLVLAPMETTPTQIASRLQSAQCDVAFIALHGTFGEDGRLQAILEQLEFPYTGSGPEASRLAFDKWDSRQRFQACGVAVPWAVRLTRSEAAEMQQHVLRQHRQQWETPAMVKPVHQGSSFGISLVQSPAQLVSAIDTALRFDDEILLEAHVRGRELTVAVFDEQALPVIEIRPHAAFFDFRAKYHADATEYLAPAPLDERTTLQVQQASLAAHRALGCRHVSRVDLILSAEGIPTVLEVNTVPGLTERSLLPMAAAACGCSFAKLCEHVVALALETRPVASDGVRIVSWL